MLTEPHIKTQQLSYAYRQNEFVLHDIEFSLEKGQTLSIVGASGSGKSTLLRILSGILPKEKQHVLTGHIQIEGVLPNQYRQTGKLAFMFQEAALLPHMTAIENIRFPLKILGQHDFSKADSLLQVVGLEQYSDYFPDQLSGGMKTRVALARSFVTEPELLLLDEPFSALDIAWKSLLYMELAKLRLQYQCTVIMVTHDVQEALLLSDRIIVLNSQGAIQMTKTIQTEFPPLERVQDISKYMNGVYAEYMLPIQEAIITGQRKKT